MRLVHESADGPRRMLATDVELADSLGAKMKGLMFSDVPDDYALVFRFEPSTFERLHERLPAPVDRLTATADHRNVHMFFVREPLDVLWLQDEEVVKTETLRPWRDIDGASADTVIEMAAGGAAGVQPGDTVRLVESAYPADEATDYLVPLRPQSTDSDESTTESDGSTATDNDDSTTIDSDESRTTDCDGSTTTEGDGSTTDAANDSLSKTDETAE